MRFSAGHGVTVELPWTGDSARLWKRRSEGEIQLILRLESSAFPSREIANGEVEMRAESNCQISEERALT